ncbi:MAG: hypothetical protein FJ160_07755 [Gammaproteobacteria bacterium]|nr:hypothetical protein [Gammaproteobacteria bacterium]
MQLEPKARSALSADGFKIDYFSVESIPPLHKPSISESDLVVMSPTRLGRTRLINNQRCTRI